MASHAVYPALDASAVASQSREVLVDLLRGRLGFEGVIVTDSIEAAAVSDRMAPETAAIRSIRAGVDLVLTTGPGSHLRSYRAILREARRSPAFERRVTEAAARVLALRRSLASG
jgi:beta-N-acetylhexosaminidase